jgi:hypothetical protein
MIFVVFLRKLVDKEGRIVGIRDMCRRRMFRTEINFLHCMIFFEP